MKVQLLPARTKWGKKMEKIIPKEQLEFYAKLFIKGLQRKKRHEL